MPEGEDRILKEARATADAVQMRIILEKLSKDPDAHLYPDEEDLLRRKKHYLLALRNDDSVGMVKLKEKLKEIRISLNTRADYRALSPASQDDVVRYVLRLERLKKLADKMKDYFERERIYGSSVHEAFVSFENGNVELFSDDDRDLEPHERRYAFRIATKNISEEELLDAYISEKDKNTKSD